MGQPPPPPPGVQDAAVADEVANKKIPQPDVSPDVSYEKGFAWSARHHLIMRIPATSKLIQAAIVCVAVLTTPFASVAEGQTNHAARIQRAMETLVASGAPGVIVLFRDGNQVIRLAAGYGELAT